MDPQVRHPVVAKQSGTAQIACSKSYATSVLIDPERHPPPPNDVQCVESSPFNG